MKRKLASSSISVEDVMLGLEVIGDLEYIESMSTLKNCSEKLKTQAVPGGNTAAIRWKSKIDTMINERTAAGTQIDPIEDPEYYKPSEGHSTKLSNIGKIILAVINVVGVVISVVALGIIGLRYMVGSVEEKAQYKELMVPYIIGVALLGGGSTIVNIIYNLFN